MATEAEPGYRRSAELELAPEGGDADDNVHFDVAAKVLGVSRKTVERMVKRGQLERGPSGAAAVVSKRSLAAVIEERRGDTPGLRTREATVEPALPVADDRSGAASGGAGRDVEAFLRPLFEPLLEELVAARTRAAVLETQMEQAAVHAAHDEQRRDELLLALAEGNWLQRRRARRLATRDLARSSDLRRVRS